MNITIRDYQASDFHICRAIWEELVQHYREIFEDLSISADDPGRDFDRYLENPRRQGTWVAEFEGKVVAFAGLLVQSEEEGEIDPVIVSSPYRNRGIGSSLIKYVTEEAIKRKIRFLSLKPMARNERALSLYVRLGFNLLGHVDLFQDLAPTPGKKWNPGIIIHDHELRY